MTKTGSQGKDCKVGSGRNGREWKRREKRATKNERENAIVAESQAGRGNRLGRQVDAARCEKIRRDR